MFVELFSADVALRPSCYYCPYCSLERCTDITIGDFWGIEDIDSVFTDNDGISMVLCNTPKGKTLWKEVAMSVETKIFPIKVLKQPNLFCATNYGCGYDAFWKIYKRSGYLRAASALGSGGSRYAQIRKVVWRIKRKLKSV